MKPVIVTNIERPDAATVKLLGELGVATVHEAQARSGLMRPYMRPIYPGARLAGPAVTVYCQPGDNLMIHAALAVVRPGDVLVVTTASESTDGMFGELLAQSCRAHGVAGLVIDAGVRDTAELTEMNFPAWSKAISAQGTVKASAGSVNIDVVCAGALVRPGDVIVGDQDGVVVIPRAGAVEIAERGVQRRDKEERTRARLRSGELGLDMYGLRAKLAELGVEWVGENCRQSGDKAEIMSLPAIGFIGFGEAGFNIAKGLRAAGAAELIAYDINANTAQLGERIRSRAAETGTALAESPAEVSRAANILFSVVTADSALEAASQNSPHLKTHHIYADLNSVSPALKQAIGKQISATGARFVEVAVMAPVSPYGHRVPMLLNGPAAAELIEILAPFGMRLEPMSGEIGAAAAVKMCRSIVVKGLEALLFECVLAASRYGAEERVFASLQESFPGIKWKDLADYMTGRVVVHGERRAHEMREVAETLQAIGIEPLMAEATALRQQWAADQDLRSFFGPDGPKTYQEVLQALSRIASREPVKTRAS